MSFNLRYGREFGFDVSQLCLCMCVCVWVYGINPYGVGLFNQSQLHCVNFNQLIDKTFCVDCAHCAVEVGVFIVSNSLKNIAQA